MSCVIDQEHGRSPFSAEGDRSDQVGSINVQYYVCRQIASQLSQPRGPQKGKYFLVRIIYGPAPLGDGLDKLSRRGRFLGEEGDTMSTGASVESHPSCRHRDLPAKGDRFIQ